MTDFHEQSATARVELRLEGAIAEYLAHYGVAESDIWSVQVIALGAVGDVLDEARANEREDQQYGTPAPIGRRGRRLAVR